MPRRRAAQKAAKFDFSSDSSDFENSEDDFNLNDWEKTVDEPFKTVFCNMPTKTAWIKQTELLFQHGLLTS